MMRWEINTEEKIKRYKQTSKETKGGNEFEVRENAEKSKYYTGWYTLQLHKAKVRSKLLM